MSDRAYMGFRIIDCPEDQFGEFSSWETTVLDLDYSFDKYLFDAEEAGLWNDDHDDAVKLLIEKFPEVSWKWWQDPVYEWSGTVAMYFHERAHVEDYWAKPRGLYRGECDAQGTPYLAAHKMIEIARQVQYPVAHEALRDILNATGVDHEALYLLLYQRQLASVMGYTL